MYRILLFSDSKWRDLAGSVFLKHQLEQLIDNCYVQVCSFHLWNEAITYFNPHLVVLSHIQGKRNKMIASHVKRHGGLVVVQYNEGIVEFDGKKDVFKSQKGADNVDLFLCWNDITSDLVDGVTVGCPRFDIYTEYKELIASRELFCDQYGLNADDPIVLFNDSWPSAKFQYDMRDFHRRNWSDLDNVLADKWSDADVFAQDQYDSQERFKLSILNVREQLPLVQLLVKSHPMSDFNRWSMWCKEHGVTLIHSEYVFNALNACDVSVSKLGSMTVAESWMLDKPAIKLGKDYDSASSLDQYHADTFNVSNDVELVEAIEKLLMLDELDTIGWGEYLVKWGIDTVNATSRSATQIQQLIESEKPETIGDVNLLAFQQAIVAHDLQYGSNKMDGFGNWDKAILQTDVYDWQRKLSVADPS